MAFWLRAAAIAAILLSNPASAAAAQYHAVTTLSLKAPFATTSDWRVTASQATAPDAPVDVPAKICFAAADQQATCTLITGRAENGAVALHYSTVKSLRIAQIAPRQKAVVFDALFPNDLRMSVQTSLWTYDRENDAFMPALTFAVTEVGKYRIFATGPLAGHVVTAEFVRGENEERYDGHRFTITVYRWMGKRGFVQLLSYVTPQRYDGETEDSPDEVQGDIFALETPRIRSLLKLVYPAISK